MGALGETRFIAGRICGRRVCFPLVGVSEVGRLPAQLCAEPPAGLPPLLHLHGRAIPILDLAAPLGLPPDSRAEPHWFVIGRGAAPVCALLDAVDGVRSAAVALGAIEIDGHAVPVIELRAAQEPAGEQPAGP